jgi:hypothetical protein
MSNIVFNRRDLVKGLITVPAVAAMNGCCTPCPKPTEMALNIVLHGAFALQFDIRASRLYVLVPAVDTADGYSHQYKVGHWGSEETLTQPVYKLEGVIDDNSHELPKELKEGNTNKGFAIVRNSLQRTAQEPHCKLDLPIPRSVLVTSAVTLQQTKPFFKTPNPLDEQPTTLPSSLVLQYAIAAGPRLPSFGPSGWVPAINLNVFAESPKNPSAGHLLDAFGALKGLYVGLDNLNLTDEALDPGQYMSVDVSRPSTISYPEIRSLQERACVMEHPPDPCKEAGNGHLGGHVGTCLALVITG